MSIVHREVIELDAPPEKVREFIMTPDRILDYYPGPIEGGVIEPGEAIYCRGRAGISLLQINQEASDEQTLVVDVYTARKLQPPYTIESIRKAAFFSMVEDWEIEPWDGGTRLTKTWRGIRKFRLRFLPMGRFVRSGAISETDKLRAAWNRAAAG